MSAIWQPWSKWTPLLPVSAVGHATQSVDIEGGRVHLFSRSGRDSYCGEFHRDGQVMDLEVQVSEGMVWIVQVGRASQEAIPRLGADGYHLLVADCRDVCAPVEVLLDNFTEIEHTAEAHWSFGYDPSLLGEVTNDTTSLADCTLVESCGPQKKISWLSECMLGIRSGDRFLSKWKTYYEPLCADFEWWWEDPRTHEDRGLHFREITYFLGNGAAKSRLVAHYYWTRPNRGRMGLDRLICALARLAIQYEIYRDVRLVENVLPANSTLDRCILGRFDQALVHHRRRLAKLRATGSSVH